MKLSLSVWCLAVMAIPMAAVNAQMTLGNAPNQQAIFSNLSAMPLAFTKNHGQWDEKALFRAEAGGAAFWFCKGEVACQFTRDTDELEDISVEAQHAAPADMPDKFNHPRYKKESMVLRAQFIGANIDPEITGEGRLAHNCNYFLGNDPSEWVTDVPNYSSITYKDIWQGIDLKYYGNVQGMKYDFIVNPGADISQIKIKYNGVQNLGVSNQGDLEAVTSFGNVYERIPEIFQEIEGIRQQVSGRFILLEEGAFGFELVERYNPAYPIVIDPELVYSTYLGGHGDDRCWSVAINASGDAYVIGYTMSADFPTQNPFQTDQSSTDVFVTKLGASGSFLVYSTYLGGSGSESGYGIAIDGNGNAYVTGRTYSPDFPTQNPYQPDQPDCDAFVSKLSPSGNSLLFSTYLGGNAFEASYDIALDGFGNVYVSGETYSSNFPTQIPYQADQDSVDVFVTKLAPSGNYLIYSTYLGGNGVDLSGGFTIDNLGSAYVTGSTGSTNFPLVNSYQNYQDSTDAFVTKLSPSGNSLIYSTCLGGEKWDAGNDIAVDSIGHAYITGGTFSSNFPTQNCYQTNQPLEDAFVSKMALSGNTLDYSTYLGGDNNDWGWAIAIDGSGQVFVTGITLSTNFPLLSSYQSDQDTADVFVTNLSSSGNLLGYSTYLGGNGYDAGYGIAIDNSGNAYVAGETFSSDFPTQNPHQIYQGPEGFKDAFITKLFAPICSYIPGDANGSNSFNGLDVTYGVSYLKGGPPPIFSCDCPPHGTWYVSGDVNASCSYNGLDITYGVSYLKGGPPPNPCADCPPGR